jgi:predicted secreted hydrolase
MRRLIACAMLAIATGPGATQVERSVTYPQVAPGTAFQFPRDHGAHPDYRTEWWYFTGWLKDEQGKPLGFQITFFRSRPMTDPANPSDFAPMQILFAHAALSDPSTGTLTHDQRLARAGFGLAGASTSDARVKLLDWQLERGADGAFRATTVSASFALDLTFTATQPVLLNGDRGYSRKGPRPEQASYYYSMPQLSVQGTIVRNGQRVRVSGRGWLDREWSSTLLDPNAVGWDWAGINLDDGGALMAFQVRGRDGRAIYAGGTLRGADGSVVVLGPDQVRFRPRRQWRSPATGALYPVEPEFLLRLPDGMRRFPLKPLFDDQELDGRAAGMPVYWEGAVTTPGGRGYLELTGYAGTLSL